MKVKFVVRDGITSVADIVCVISLLYCIQVMFEVLFIFVPYEKDNKAEFRVICIDVVGKIAKVVG